MPADVYVDAMILDYLEQATRPGWVPAGEALDAERVAAIRLFFWTHLAVGATAKAQYLKAPHAATLDRIAAIGLLEPVMYPDDQPSVDARVAELVKHHSDPEDCRIVAEAELFGMNAVATFDKDLCKHLGPVAGLPVVFPSVLWEQLAIPRGTQPWRALAPGNPLIRATFWWD